MKTIEPFVIAVSEMGLPRDVCPIALEGYENVTALSPEECTRLYWMLSGMHVRYAYVLNGRRVERDYWMRCEDEPVMRLVNEPEVFYEHMDGDIEVAGAFNVGEVAREEENRYAMQLTVYEGDEEEDFVLSLQDYSRNKYYLGRRGFTFMGRELSLKLWSSYKDWAGGVEFVAIEEEYYRVGPL